MNKKNNEGFTLVEVLAVVVILGILMTIAMPTYNSVYNSIKRSTYLNKIKTVTVAAKSYANNSEVKDSIQDTYHNSTSGQWFKVINISDLIESGAIQGDGDFTSNDGKTLSYVENIYTGKGLGHNVNPSYSNDVTDYTVALLYCYDSYDVDAFLINDLGSRICEESKECTDSEFNEIPNRTYYEGEVVRNPYPINSSSFISFGIAKIDFSYSKLATKLYNAYKNGNDSVTYKGIKIDMSTINAKVYEDGIKDSDFIRRLNQTIMDYLTTETECPHK